MNTHRIRFVNITIATLLLLLTVSQVKEVTATEVAVGPAAVRPVIDGRWHQAEWVNSIEYTLTTGQSSPSKNVSAYVRMMHDVNNLYGVLDVPSDNGATYINTNGDISWGAVLFVFYYGRFLNPTNQTQLYTLFALNTNETRMVNVGVYCRCPGKDPNVISSASEAATTISATPHSSLNHRIWEFSFPIHPYVIEAPLDQNPAIGFDVTVIDSSGNQMSLVTLAQHAELTFVSIQVPELFNVPYMLPFALIMPLTLLFARHRRRR